MSTMDIIKDTLETLAADSEYPFTGGVFYGVCTARELDEWNYFVFNRTDETVRSDHRVTSRYEVHIIHEDYIMEDYPLTVINALKSAISGFTPDENTTYEYITKGNTELVVEMCTLTFKEARKVNV